MRNTITIALLACMALSAPPAQGHALPVADIEFAAADTVAQDAYAFNGQTVLLTATTVSPAMALLASGCCDQGYEIKSLVASAAQPAAMLASGCCDQGYEIKSFSALHSWLLGLVALSALAFAWTCTAHFKRTTTSWTLQH